jgi:rubrerythrin
VCRDLCFRLSFERATKLEPFALLYRVRAIAEAAYRTVVLQAGKNQSTLSPGWEVLGLNRDAATRIWDTEKKEGFLSDRESMYGGQTRKYDKQGRQVDADGKLANPEEAAAAAAQAESAPEGATSNVYECGECGFTLFIAQGRESKFYGTDFKCPECGAAKDKFKARDDVDE